MKSIPIFATILFLVGLVTLQAKDALAPDLSQIKHPVKPLLWKIEGKGMKKPSYLFGTIHLSDERVATLHPQAQKAFDQADVFFAEVDLSPEKQVTATTYLMRKGDESLSEIVGEKVVAALDRELKAINPQLSSKVFEPMNIWAIGAALPLLEDQLQGKKPLDMQLWEKATQAGKKTGALETYKKQFGSLDKLTLKDQIELLDVTLQVMKKSRELGVPSYRDLLNAYLLGDLQIIDAAMKADSTVGIEIDKAMNARFRKLLLDGRNPGMAQSILQAISMPDAGSCFFAAGAGHYVGKNNITELVKAAGYQVTLVQ